jgi:hypothetical protein
MTTLRKVCGFVKLGGAFFVAATVSTLLLIGLVLFYFLNAVFLVVGVVGLFVSAIGYGGCSLFAITLPEASLRAIRRVWDWVEALANQIAR